MNQVRIVTDSTSDIPADVAEELGIAVVPAYVQIGDRSYRDEPGGALSREEFYALLPGLTRPPTTSTPPPHEFAAAYHRLLEQASHVIAIVVSATLSGMHNVASLAAHEVSAARVHVVDSGQITMGLGWLVIVAAEHAAAGLGVRDILARIEEMKQRVRVYALLDSLEYLRRSGRVSWARAKVAEALRIKPLIEVMMGKVADAGRTHTRARAIERLIQLTRALGPLERLAVLHTCAPDLEDFRQRLYEFCSPDKLLTVAVTTVIGSHVGPRGLGVAVVTAPRG